VLFLTQWKTIKQLKDELQMSDNHFKFAIRQAYEYWMQLQAEKAKYKKLEQEFKVLDEELYRLEKKDIDATCQGIRADKAESKVADLVSALEQINDHLDKTPIPIDNKGMYDDKSFEAIIGWSIEIQSLIDEALAKAKEATRNTKTD